MTDGLANGAGAARILFIGNSYTDRNDLPGRIVKRASRAGRVVETDRVMASGMPLRHHWNKGAALEAIRRAPWDFVVLQEQSTLPLKSPARFHESVRLFDTVIREHGARTVLYQTWARRDAFERQSDLTESFRVIGEELGAVIVPVGEAWRHVMEERPEIKLHDADGSHPTPAGTHLAACVFHAVLFGDEPSIPNEPSGADDVPGVDAETTRILEETARGFRSSVK